MDEKDRHELVAQLNALAPDDRKAIGSGLTPKAVRDINESNLRDTSEELKRRIWIGIFVLVLVVLAGALAIVIYSFSVDLTTTTGTGKTKVTAVTHPDVSAAYAIITAVIAGIVGLLAPTPTLGSKPPN